MGECRLFDLVEENQNMKILIDEDIETDSDGNLLVNVGYIRVSTDRQAELGFGLDVQEKEIFDYCRRSDIKNLLLFIDDGYTGTNMDRPALRQITAMIEDYNHGYSNIRVNSMIVPKIDRLGRTLLGTLQFIQDYIVARRDSKNSSINCNKEDINFVSIAENYCRVDRNNPQGKFLLMLFMTLAEFDRDMIVEKLQKGKEARVASGLWWGGGVKPHGYMYNKELGILEIVPEEAERIREVYRLYIEEGVSPAKIADRLGYKNESVVIAILKRKSLTGCMVYKGVEYPGAHEPIIPLERWEEAQDEFKKRSAFRGESVYMLSGLLYCGECGAKMRYQKWNPKTGECKIVCYSTQKSKPALVRDENCQSGRLWQSEVEDAVVHELFKLSYLNDESKTKTAQSEGVMENLRKELALQKKKLSRLLDFDDDFDDDILDEKIRSCRKKIKEIEAQIKDENERDKITEKIENTKGILRTLESTWEYMTPKERQIICQELIDKILIFKDGTINVYLKLKKYITA